MLIRVTKINSNEFAGTLRELQVEQHVTHLLGRVVTLTNEPVHQLSDHGLIQFCLVDKGYDLFSHLAIG
jgi:hypothetical protein